MLKLIKTQSKSLSNLIDTKTRSTRICNSMQKSLHTTLWVGLGCRQGKSKSSSMKKSRGHTRGGQQQCQQCYLYSVVDNAENCHCHNDGGSDSCNH